MLATLDVAVARGNSMCESCVLTTSMAAQQVSQVGVSSIRCAAFDQHNCRRASTAWRAGYFFDADEINRDPRASNIQSPGAKYFL